MGRKENSKPKEQRDNNQLNSKKSSKRKKTSPTALDQTEKKVKHSDSESATSENWLDIELPSDTECDNTIEFDNMSQSILNQTQGNMTIIPGNIDNSIPGMSTPGIPGMATPGLTNQPQMMFPQHMYSMPSPIVQQLPTASISDSDAIRIATLIKDMIKEELSSMIKEQVDAQTKDLRQEVKALQLHNAQLKEDLSTIKSNQDELEQYSRRNCVRIGNVKEQEGESTDNIVLDICKTSGATINANDIDRSHRVGKPKAGKTREIIVKFVSYKSRSAFIRSRKTLREKKCDVYLNEDLTQTRKNLDYECRKLKKDPTSVVQSTWTYDGRQYIKTDQDVSVKINNLSDLLGYGYVPKPITPK